MQPPRPIFSARDDLHAEASLLHLADIRPNDPILIDKDVRSYLILFGIIGDVIGIFRYGFAPQFIQIEALRLL